MGITEELYFPTPIFAGRLDEAPQLNPALLDLIYAERGEDATGTQRSNYRALNGWHSRTSLHREPAYADLERYLLSTGRHKLVVGLYRDLARTEAGLELGRRIYAKARPGYHATIRAAVERLLLPGGAPTAG